MADQQHEAIREAYSARALEYADLFGSMEATHPSDRALVGSWAATLTGPVLDVGCGPGHWSGFLAGNGVEVSGIDPVRRFVDLARLRHPHLPFEVGRSDALDVPTGSLGGVLSWYSLIHHHPRHIRVSLAEFARALRPGGSVAVGFFEGVGGQFDHAVTTAYRWPVAELCRELVAVGFEVLETHTRTAGTHRPHGAIVARRTRDRCVPGLIARRRIEE
ncbi:MULTISPECIES: class I SAM-dependent methyltransferase [unclassified Dietzia]|uniref:class I SAM-dependent methyltransferase n=1 Tax=unclassified Dietzia TaxID=2617939 RepID=UPI000D1FFC49|nr:MULTISPECIES: methyltransferase domain-containing protein [unclassified Dietzia]AVZ41362.1 SAM-dependent methyltransferase [Dietzia sp. JS16-p6b]